MAVTKEDLIAEIASQADISKTAAGVALDAFTKALTVKVQEGEVVHVAGLGRFQKAARAARKGRNPATGEMMEIAARNVAVFKPSKSFADLVK